jgi:hypothetical protein
VKNSMKAVNYPNTPLTKLIPNLVACVVIASLSASAIANQINPKSKTPAQVEQALAALLNSRDTNIQLASYTGTQPSNNINNLVVTQIPTKTVDHSQKSIAELVLAGLAITNSVKDELSSPVTVSEPTPPPRDYAVADIVSVEELDRATNDDMNSIIENAEPINSDIQETLFAGVEVAVEAMVAEDNVLVEAVLVEAVLVEAVAEGDASEESTALNVDTSEFRPIEETVDSSSQLSKQVSSNITEASKDAIPALPSPILEELNKEIELAASDNINTSTAVESAVMITEIAETDVADIEIVEIEIAETEVAEIKTVETEIAETELTPTEILEDQAPTLLAKVSVAYTAISQGSITDTPVTNSEKPQIADNAGANVNVAVRSEACPENFNQVSIPVNGKLCQIFAADFPASMILFIPQTPEEVVKYYLASSSSFVEPKKIKQRTMLKSADNNTTLIISKDGGGTQVDILVKSPVS